MHLPPVSHLLERWSRLALLLALGWTGCAGPVVPADSALQGPFYQPRNFAGEAKMPASLRRVVLLPVYTSDPALSETVEVLDQVLRVALQNQARFEVVSLSRGDARRWFGADAHASVSALPHGYIQTIATNLGADGVLFVDLTDYKAYRPLRVGYRAKLVLAAEIQMVWSFDEVISADVPGVSNAARRHVLQTDREGPPIDRSPAILQSPSRFAAFAADLMFQTLPPR